MNRVKRFLWKTAGSAVFLAVAAIATLMMACSPKFHQAAAIDPGTRASEDAVCAAPDHKNDEARIPVDADRVAALAFNAATRGGFPPETVAHATPEELELSAALGRRLRQLGKRPNCAKVGKSDGCGGGTP
jgi:hypothetical protein